MIQTSHHELASSYTHPQTQSQTNWFLFAFINQHHSAFLITIYIANIIVTAVVGSINLFATHKASVLVFSEAYETNDSMRIIGAFWIAIGIVSAMGIFNPLKFSPILIIQIIYKGLYLLVEVLPKLIRKQQVPTGVASFFLAWVIILPLIVPWKYLFTK